MWGGMLSNLAAGAFLVFLKPFKVGDFISAGDVTGTVKEIGLFSTTIDTPDNSCTFVGNNKIFTGNIQNFAANPYRRVDRKVRLHHDVDPARAIQMYLGAAGHFRQGADAPGGLPSLTNGAPAYSEDCSRNSEERNSLRSSS